MSRLKFNVQTRAQSVLESIYEDINRRLVGGPTGLCPVEMSAAMVSFCHAQTCGKCVPCRIGLGQLNKLMDDILDGRADAKTLELLERTAKAISASADCAIGFEAADMVLKGLAGFRSDFISHATTGKCEAQVKKIPCIAKCPASVDIPGYISLVAAGRNEDAIRLIRKDNPFPVVCGHICEHPCETHCRRSIIDAPMNIRGLKKYAAANVGVVPPPENLPATGKTVGIIGGGPAGLTAAYFLSLMGHKCTVYEKRKYLGGMLRYGIPSYRLPREELQRDIDCVLSTGVEVFTDVDISKDMTLNDMREKYDAVYIAIGAHTDKKLGIEGEGSRGVMSAVQMLRGIGDGVMPDFTDKNVVIVGGGNVAMDCTRSAKRLGAKKVTCVYRRRKEDMTALPEEVEGAIAEGCVVMELAAPDHIEADSEGNAAALWAQPQMIGPVKRGRPAPIKADVDPVRIPADIIVVAIGQNIETEHFEANSILTKWGCLMAEDDGSFKDFPGVFAGGDCVSGPATVIKAIDAGKVAAANIDRYLGFAHELTVDIDLPEPNLSPTPAAGRVNMIEREPADRADDFEPMEMPMSCQEAMQEANRCLRCDRSGYGCFRGGRTNKW